LRFVFNKPTEVDTNWFLEVTDLFIKYGISDVYNFWESYEELIDILYRFSDIDALSRVCRSGIQPKEIEKLEPTVFESEDGVFEQHLPLSILLSSTEEDISYDKVKCAIYEDMHLTIPCGVTSCQHFSRHSDLNCGYNSKDPNLTSFEVVAEKLNMPLNEVTNLYNKAVKKIQELPRIASELIEPEWDNVCLDGLCSLCTSEINPSADDKYKEYNGHYICSDCVAEYSFAGAKLILKFRRDLKDIIVLSGKKFTNFQAQAFALGVGVSVLQNLYNRVGINRRTSQAASRAYLITYPRPGRTILNSNVEYIMLEVLAAKNIFGEFDSGIIDKIKSLTDTLQSFNIDYKNVIPLS
jgi:hypothetical protein